MITVSALMAQGLYLQVKSHLVLGKKHGLTKEDCLDLKSQVGTSNVSECSGIRKMEFVC